MRRLEVVQAHLTGTHVPKHTWFKPSGWGFKDTNFELLNSGQVKLTGSRYLASGKILPHFREWAEKAVGLDLSESVPAQVKMPVAPPRRHEEFNRRVKQFCDVATEDDEERGFHSHGHTLQELFDVRYGRLAHYVDLVVYPRSHEDVVGLVALAMELNVVLIPFGGGTNVTQAVMVPIEERTVVSVDMSKMNHVLAVNRENMTALVQTGICGTDLEKELGRYGVCCGHEPDSFEFSTLGGWISTRASGMKKNTYGNIEDIVITMKIVTPIGVFEKITKGPRVSNGPDINHVVFGHEGLLGIITEALVKVKHLPEKKAYGSFVFPNFEFGTKFMYELGIEGVRPSSVRLVDNAQFQFAMAIKPLTESKVTAFMDKIKKYYLLKIKQFDPNKMCVATLVYEGQASVVRFQQSQVGAIARKNHGMYAGAENGIRGYFLTYIIAYIRDFAMDYHVVAESFETSVPYDKAAKMIDMVTRRIEVSCAAKGVTKPPFVSSRITQLYDSGCAVYVYFAFYYKGLKNPAEIYSQIEDEARDEVLKWGGSLSHHHGSF